MGRLLEKTLSANDTGETGTHQAGVLIPKHSEALGVFPSLDPSVLNPRATLIGLGDDGRSWLLNFIYYNNGLFGGTRNEYRLTGVGPYLRDRGAQSGDVLQIERQGGRTYRLILVRLQQFTAAETGPDEVVRLRLSGSWRLVKW